MSDPLRLSGPIVLGKRATAPSNPSDGMIYFDTTLGKYQQYRGGSFKDIPSTPEIQALIDDAVSDVVDDSITDGVTDRAPSQNAVFDALALKISSSEKGAANGVAPLGADSLIPSVYLPSYVDDVVEYADLASLPATGETGKIYITLDDNKQYRWTGSVYIELVASPGTTDAVPEGVTNLYFTEERAQDATISQVITNGVTDKAPSEDAVFDALAGKSNTGHTHVAADITDFGSAARSAAVADAIANGVTDVAPSQNAVFDALALKADSSVVASKLDNVVEDLTPQLGGDLDLNGKVVAGDLKRSALATPTTFITEKYIHSIALSGSQTDTAITALTFAHASFEGCEIVAKIKEATTGDIKICTIRVVTNGTVVSLNEVSVETADTGITFSAAIVGADVVIRYSSGSNGATMRADVKLIAA